MLHDPADKTHRKLRQIKNTPLAKYVHFISLGLTLLYAGAMYISYRRNVLPLINDEEYKKMFEEMRRQNMITECPEFLKGINDTFVWGKRTAHAESKDMQTDEA